MLKIEGLSVSYGGLTALRGVSVSVEEGQFVAIVGPNGAGKTTLFKAISGVVPTRSGTVTYDGRDLLAIPPHERVHLGIAHVPEGRQVFPSLTVLENLEMGAYSARGRSGWQQNIERIFALFPVLAERRKQPAGTLSGGEQQMLAIGRALMSAPRLLLLDEPFLGLAPLVVAEIRAALERLRATGLTILMVEQKLDIALGFASRAYVLIKGKVALDDSTARLAKRADINDLYFALATS